MMKKESWNPQIILSMKFGWIETSTQLKRLAPTKMMFPSVNPQAFNLTVCGGSERVHTSSLVATYVAVTLTSASCTLGSPWVLKSSQLTCTRWEILNNRLQLALTSLLLDNAGSQPRCVVRHADIASQINNTLVTRTSFGNGSDRARCFMVVQNPHKMKLDPNTCSFPQCRKVETISPLFFG